MDFSERLEWAIQEWPGGGKKAFSNALKARGMWGSSYRTLMNYLSGDTKPSKARWFAEAADVLGVSEKWLASGEGTMSGKPDSIPEASATDGSGSLDIQALWEECAGSLASKLPWWVGSPWYGALIRYVFAQPEPHASTYQELIFTASGREKHPKEYETLVHLGKRLLGFALMPLPSGETDWGSREWGNYLQICFLSQQMAAPQEEQGIPLDEYLEQTERFPPTIRGG